MTQPPVSVTVTMTSARLAAALGRLARIAEAHHQQVDVHGGTWGDCNECGWNWPCPTWVWATVGRDPVSDPWDPDDD